ncbi:MAG: hypothetical protein KJI72_02460 [Patescibacteria group bacterium]|nr:hypothetical protein [Patescibacteria group bacterium]
MPRGETRDKTHSRKPKKSRSRPSAKALRFVTPQWTKRLLWIVVTILILVVLGTAIFFVSYYRSSSIGVVIEVNAPDKIYRGVPFEVDVSIDNQTDNIITQAELTLSPTNGIVNLRGFNGRGIISDSIGDMGSGSLTRKTYRFLATGEIGSSGEIAFSLSYFSAGRTRFEVNEVKKVNVSDLAIEIEVEKPDQILPGSTFELDIGYQNVSNFDFSEAVLEVKYPSPFKFISSSLTPDSLNNYWRLGELRSGSSGNIQVRGTLEGAAGSPFVIPIVFSAKFLGQDYPVVEQEVELAIAPSPINVQTFINRRTDYVARIGDQLTYTILYENSSGIALADVVIKTELIGELFDFTTLEVNADTNLSARTVTWDVSKIPALRLLDPGASGEVSLRVKLKNQFPINRLNDKNFNLRFSTKISSPSVPYYLQAPKTEAIASLEAKVAGLILVDVRGFYRDALSGILNSGLIPPKVNLPTQYTVHWVIRNYSTDVKDVSLRTVLPLGVRWTGIVKSNIDSVPLYNEETREIIWAIETIRATKGVLDDPIETVFQVEATPSVTDIGKFQQLTNETTLRAVDEFTGLELFSSDVALNTSLPDDITIGQNGGRIVP